MLSIVGRRNRIIFSIGLLPTNKGRVLDVGSADGLLLETLDVNNAIGSDIAAEYCRKMRRKGTKAVNCAAEYLPFADETFNIITCTEVLEHVLYPNRVIKEIYRLFRSQGYPQISEPHCA